jgi:hypothetical protein
MARLLQGWPLALSPRPGGGGAACCVTRDVAAGELLLRAGAYAVVAENAWAERVLCVGCGAVSPNKPLARACRECASVRFCSAACASAEAQRHAACCGWAARAALAPLRADAAADANKPLTPDERTAVRLAVAARLQHHAAVQRVAAPERTLNRGAPTYTDVVTLPLPPPPEAHAAGRASGSDDGSGSWGSDWSSSAEGGSSGGGGVGDEHETAARWAFRRGAAADGAAAAAAAAERAAALAELAHAALLTALPDDAVPSRDELHRLLALVAAHSLTLRAGGGSSAGVAVARVLAPGAALLTRCGDGGGGGASAELSLGSGGGFCVEARAMRDMRAGEEVRVAAGGALARCDDTRDAYRAGGQQPGSCAPTPLLRSRAASPAAGAPPADATQQQMMLLPPPPPARGPRSWLRAGCCCIAAGADASPPPFPPSPVLSAQQVVPLALSLTPFAAAVYLPPSFCLRAERRECVADGASGTSGANANTSGAAEALYAAPFAARCFAGVLHVELLRAENLPWEDDADDDVASGTRRRRRVLCALSCDDAEAGCALDSSGSGGGGGGGGDGGASAQLPLRQVACAALRLRLRADAPTRCWRARAGGEPLGGAELPLAPLLLRAQGSLLRTARRTELLLHLRGPGGGGTLRIALRFEPHAPPSPPPSPAPAAAHSDADSDAGTDDDDAPVADIGTFEPLCFFDHAPTHTQAALWRRRRTLVLAFRGTEGQVAADWVTDFQYRLVPRRTASADGGGAADAAARGAAARAACRVHEGAQKGYLAVRRRVLAALDDARGVARAAESGPASRTPSALGAYAAAAPSEASARSSGSPPLLPPPRVRRARAWRVLLTGHSLGGALATLCAADLAELFPQPLSPASASDDIVRVRCVTYGSPRAGDARFAARFAVLQPRALRLVNGRDVVPAVPPRLLGYTHACDGLHLRADGALAPLPPHAEPSGARVWGALCSGAGILDHGFGLYTYVDGLRRVAAAAGVAVDDGHDGGKSAAGAPPAGGRGHKAADDGGAGAAAAAALQAAPAGRHEEERTDDDAEGASYDGSSSYDSGVASDSASVSRP